MKKIRDAKVASLPEVRQVSLWLDAWRRLRRHKLAMAGLVIICVLIMMALGAPLISPYDPVKMVPRAAFQPPTFQHILGTDEYGRDILSRVIFGARISLAVSIISVSLSLLVGTLLGLVSGYCLGVADLVIMRLMDVLSTFPPILLALLFMTILGRGIDRVMLAIGLVYTPLFGRLCRGAVLAERGKAYIEAARMVGCSNARIIGRHILPNVTAPVIVQATLCLSYAILAEAALSFLGLGTQPPTPSWGVMLSRGRDLLHHSPWLAIWPGLSIMAVVLGFNMLGDGLQDALDPRLKN